MFNLSNSDCTKLGKAMESLVKPIELITTARLCGFIQRLRGLRPDVLILALFSMFECSSGVSITGLYNRYRYHCGKLGYSDISFAAFRNQLNKSSFEDFARRIFDQITAASNSQCISDMRDLIDLLREKGLDILDMIVSDGCELRLRDAAAIAYGQGDTCKGLVGTCQKKLHGTLSLIYQTFRNLAITNGVSSERAEVPVSQFVRCLWMADAGYVHFGFFAALDKLASFYLVRGTMNMNPTVLSLVVYDDDGQYIETITLGTPTPLKKLAPKLDKKLSYDMDVVLSNGHRCRVIRSYVPDTLRSTRGAKAKGKDGFAYFYTNLPREMLDLKQVIAIYHARWGIEIYWKALKSFNNLRTDRLLKNSVIHGMLLMCLAWLSLKIFMAKQAEPLLRGNKLSILKIAIHSGEAILDLFKLILKKGQSPEDHEEFNRTARLLFQLFGRCVKEKPSKINREQGRAVACIIKELRRPPVLSRADNAA